MLAKYQPPYFPARNYRPGEAPRQNGKHQRKTEYKLPNCPTDTAGTDEESSAKFSTELLKTTKKKKNTKPKPQRGDRDASCKHSIDVFTSPSSVSQTIKVTRTLPTARTTTATLGLKFHFYGTNRTEVSVRSHQAPWEQAAGLRAR